MTKDNSYFELTLLKKIGNPKRKYEKWHLCLN